MKVVNKYHEAPEELVDKEAVRDNHLQDIRLCSFSEVSPSSSNSILLWAHYTNGHEGMCVEYDFNEGYPFPARRDFFGEGPQKLPPLSVTYQDEYPYVEHWSEQEKEQWVRAARTKSKHWAYEQEWRVIEVPNVARMNQDLPQEIGLEFGTVKSVTLGAKLGSYQVELISDYLKDIPGKPSIYRSRLAKNKYDLEIEDVTPIRSPFQL